MQLLKEKGVNPKESWRKLQEKLKDSEEFKMIPKI